MASRSLKLRLHVFSSKLHKWLALLIGAQVLLWMGTGALMSFLDLEEVRSEHIVSRAAQILPAGAELPEWLERQDDVVSVATRALDGKVVTEVRRADGGVTLHDPHSGRLLFPISAATARAIARRAWIGPETSVAGARLVERDVGTEFRGPFPAWQITYDERDATRVYIDASSGTVLSARSDTWRLFDFIWGLHIMDWTQRDRINSWWLLLFGIAGTFIALSGFVLLANRLPRIGWLRGKRKSGS